jgi:hypothetical protein
MGNIRYTRSCWRFPFVSRAHYVLGAQIAQIAQV